MRKPPKFDMNLLPGDNPWQLTRRDEQFMRLLLENGSQKAAAIDMGVTKGTASKWLARVAKQMQARTKLLAVVEFQRWQMRQKVSETAEV